MIRPYVIVRLLNSAGAKNHYERMVCQILEAEGPLQAAGLVKRVARICTTRSYGLAREWSKSGEYQYRE